MQNKEKKRDKQPHEKPALIRYIDHSSSNWYYYKKIDKVIILDGNLSLGDKATYMAILHKSDLKKARKISLESLRESISKISKQSLVESIKKLENKGYIKVYRSRYESSYKISNNPKQYLKISLEHFNGLKMDYRTYIKRLIAITLSSSNNKIPTYKTCLCNTGKITRKLYNELIHDFYFDNDFYLDEEKLKDSYFEREVDIWDYEKEYIDHMYKVKDEEFKEFTNEGIVDPTDLETYVYYHCCWEPDEILSIYKEENNYNPFYDEYSSLDVINYEKLKC